MKNDANKISIKVIKIILKGENEIFLAFFMKGRITRVSIAASGDKRAPPARGGDGRDARQVIYVPKHQEWNER